MISKNDFIEKQILVLVPKNGDKLSFRNDNVLITDHSGKVIHQSTCYRVFAIFIVGHMSITTGLIQRAKKFGFSISLLTTTFRPYQTISAFAQANVILRQNQYGYCGMGAAKRIVQNKIRNQILPMSGGEGEHHELSMIW